MAYINDSAFDAALSWIKTNTARLDICSSEPVEYSEVSTYTLGYKESIAVGSPADGTVSGRRVTVPAISDGTVTGTGTASYWALTDGSDTLVATGSMTNAQSVTTGNEFILAAFDVTFPDATTS